MRKPTFRVIRGWANITWRGSGGEDSKPSPTLLKHPWGFYSVPLHLIIHWNTSSPLSWYLLSSPSCCPTPSSFELCYSSSPFEFESNATLSLGLFRGSACNSYNRKFLWQGKEWKEGSLVYSGRWMEYFSPLCRPSEKGQCLHCARLFLMSPRGQLRSSRERKKNDT